MENRQAGTLLADRFRLVERVGRGGFGETWRAQDEMLGIDVAVKLYYDNDPERTERYLREARSLARFSSLPGIAGVRDFLNIDGMACLVMEYVDGEDLSSMLARTGRFTVEQTMRALLPVAEVLACLHREGVLHRDVSPDNVRIAKNGMGVLLDFGSALSKEQMSVGTITVKPGYAPPEQYGDPSTQGPWTDVYSLAATAYQCLCGKAPSDSLRRTFSDDLVAPSGLGVTLPPAFEDALMKALELDYTKRTQSVGEFVSSLRGQGQTAAPVAPQTAPSKPEPVAPAEPAPVEPVVKPERQSEPVAEQPRVEQPHQEREEEPPLQRANRENDGDTGSKQPKKKRRSSEFKSERTSRGGSSNKRLVPIIAAVAVVLVLGIVVLLARAGGSSSSSQNLASQVTYITNENVTANVGGMLENGYGGVNFTNCIVSDDAVQALAEQDQLKSITFIKCQGFKDLSPLADAPNLESLTLMGFDEMDLAKIFPKDMPKLKELKLTMVRVASGTDALGHFTGLTKLVLSPTEGIDNVDFLSSMPELDTLTLAGIDLSGNKADQLKGLQKLTYLDINYCNVESLDWLPSCTELSTLEASGNNVSDLSPIAGLDNLKSVYFDSNQISDISPLAGMNLSTLVLSNNSISDATPLRDSQSIDTLSLEGNKLTTADGLQGMSRLRRLSLAHNEITDLSAITEDTKLEEVDVSYNGLTDLSACERLIALEHLYAQHNQLADISHISACSQLSILLLQDNQITDISALSNGFSELATLNIAFNQIESLKPLADSPKLRFLVANDNHIGTLEGLAEKHELEDLMLDNNQITDISAIASSTDNLENLDLGHNQIEDISALANLSPTSARYGTENKMSICLDHNNISSIASIPSTMSFRLLALHANPLKDFGSLAYETAKWYDLYLPYYEDADFASLGELSIASVTNLVDVPYDKQVQVLRNMGLTTDSLSQPHFITSEKAEEDMAAFRDEVNSEVSGTTTAPTGQVDGEESVQVSDDDVTPSGDAG